MDNLFSINPSVDSATIHDAIFARITKAKAITTCLLNSQLESTITSNSLLHGLLWAIDDYLEEIDSLHEKLIN